MESQTQQPDYANTTPPESIAASTPAPLAMLAPASQSQDQWQEVGEQVSVFLAEMPDKLGQFFNTYKQPLTSIGLIFTAVVAVKVVLAILDALNDIPLLSPTFELVGIGYSIWFVNRYLLKKSNRIQLSEEFDSLRQQIMGSKEFPEG